MVPLTCLFPPSLRSQISPDVAVRSRVPGTVRVGPVLALPRTCASCFTIFTIFALLLQSRVGLFSIELHAIAI
mgnify:CR=1 FL=1